MDAQPESLKDRTLKAIDSLGLAFTVKPGEKHKQMPEDPTRLGPKDLQRSLTGMVAWLAYANEALAQVEIELLEAEAALKKAQAVFRHTCSEALKWKIDDQMMVQPGIRKKESRVQSLQAMQVGLKAVVQNYENKSKALSRELTRRMSEYDRSGRI